MLTELSKKDTYWRKVAFNLCKDYELANDIVHDMYLKLHDCEKQISDFYVIIVLRNLFIDHTRRKKLLVGLEIDLPETKNEFSYDDNELKIVNGLSWLEKGYLELNYDMSLREMEKELNTNYGYIYRVIKEAKEKVTKHGKEKS